MKNALKFYKDFPKEGIVFVDIIPLLQDKKLFAQLIESISENLTAPNVVAPEARGFLFTAPLLLQSPMVENIIPIRKSGSRNTDTATAHINKSATPGRVICPVYHGKHQSIAIFAGITGA